MNRGYRYRAYPTPAQAAQLSRTLGCARVVWNKALEERHRRWATEQRGTTYVDTSAWLTGWKRRPDLAYLREVASVPLQQALRNQQAAFAGFFAKRARYPRFKSRRGRQSMRYVGNAFRLRDGALELSKLEGALQIVWSRPLPPDATVSSLTVSREPDGRWYVSFLIDAPHPAPLPRTGQQVGVDLGLKDFAVLSTGERIPNPKHMAARERRLKRYQRMVARRQPGSANRNKARRKVARIHSRVRDARQDFLHKTTTDLVRRFDTIAVENLPVANLVRTRALSKAIEESGWGEFRRQLAYKADWYGRTLVVIDRWYPSSKTCSACGHLLARLSLGTRQWTCPDCGTRHDRDLNAAKNILAAGLAAGAHSSADACGGDVRRCGATRPLSPMKQEAPSGQ